MGKWLIGALLAATAWTPAAQAQDGGWRGRHGGDGQQRPAEARPQGQGQRQGGWNGNRGGEERARAQVQLDAGQRRGWNGGAQVDGQAQNRAQGDWQGRRDWQGRQPRVDAAPAQAAPQAPVFAGRDRNGDGRRDWASRDRNGDGRPDFTSRDRNGDGRPDGFRRDDRGSGWQGNRQAFGDDRNDGRRLDNGTRYDNRGGWNDGRGYNNGGRWNSGWRRDDRYNWNSYRSYNRNAFRLPRYYAPYGWDYGYRRFSIGVVLTQSLFGQNYWIDDPYSYRLPEADGPYRWVRYYNDALLIDLRSGVVVDTVYDIFWY